VACIATKSGTSCPSWVHNRTNALLLANTSCQPVQLDWSDLVEVSETSVLDRVAWLQRSTITLAVSSSSSGSGVRSATAIENVAEESQQDVERAGA
jgi:hypothetical protein